MELLEVLKELSEFGAVCGDEYRLSEHLMGMFSDFGHKIDCDRMGNVVVHLKGTYGEKRLLIFTHIDEPGLVITSIDEKGFLRFKPVGGIKAEDLASQEVIVYGKKPIPGLIGLRPPHILSREEQEAPVTQEELNIDIGLSQEMAEKIVKPGDTAVIKRSFMYLQKNKVCGKALGDRAGIATLYETLKKIKGVKYDVFLAFGVGHYNNHLGAKAVSQSISPDMAIVLDFVEARSRENPNLFQECGKGPTIYRGPSAHPGLTEWLMSYAHKNSIRYQIKAASGKNPTDAWAIQVACGGVPTAIVLNPVKYPGSSVESVDTGDLLETSRFLAGFLEYIDDKDWGELLCF